MAEKQLIENYLDYYAQNIDWKERTVKDEVEIVSYQDNSTMRIFYNEQTDNYDAHCHPAMEVIMPVDNYYDVVSGNSSYHLLPGEILIIPPGDIHRLIAPPSGKRFIFLFDISYIVAMKGFHGVQAYINGCIHINKTDYPQIYDEVYQLFVQMRNEYFNNNDFKELSIYSHLINFFVLYGRNRLNNTDLFPSGRIYKQKEYIQKFNDVLEYIDMHYAEDLTLEDVASYSGFSKYHFTRLFKLYTNTTFYECLSFKRIKAAEQLLAEPDLSITEIALQVGFSSISTFNRVFRQQKNCTPSEYRSLCVKYAGRGHFDTHK